MMKDNMQDNKVNDNTKIWKNVDRMMKYFFKVHNQCIFKRHVQNEFFEKH